MLKREGRKLTEKNEVLKGRTITKREEIMKNMIKKELMTQNLGCDRDGEERIRESNVLTTAPILRPNQTYTNQ